MGVGVVVSVWVWWSVCGCDAVCGGQCVGVCYNSVTMATGISHIDVHGRDCFQAAVNCWEFLHSDPTYRDGEYANLRTCVSVVIVLDMALICRVHASVQAVGSYRVGVVQDL